MTYKLDHELLAAYQVSLDFARWAASISFPQGRSHLRDQLVRAADSVVLNIAEGTGRGRGRARQNHYRMARGSLCECAAVLDLLGESERKVQASKVDAMLRGLLRC